MHSLKVEQNDTDIPSVSDNAKHKYFFKESEPECSLFSLKAKAK